MNPPASLEIRAYEPSDLSGLSEVFSQPGVIWGTLATPHISQDQRQKAFSADGPNAMRLVAVLDGRIVGGSGLHRHDQRRRAHAASIGMGVHDAFVGRGVGTALMAAMVDVADRWWNLKRLELEVYADNARAIGLYARFGFEREGLFRAHAFRDGVFVDTLAMARLKP